MNNKNTICRYGVRYIQTSGYFDGSIETGRGYEAWCFGPCTNINDAYLKMENLRHGGKSYYYLVEEWK